MLRQALGNQVSKFGVIASMDGLLDAKILLHDLTSGAMAVMCPAFDAAWWPLAQVGSANKPHMWTAQGDCIWKVVDLAGVCWVRC